MIPELKKSKLAKIPGFVCNVATLAPIHFQERGKWKEEKQPVDLKLHLQDCLVGLARKRLRNLC